MGINDAAKDEGRHVMSSSLGLDGGNLMQMIM